MSETENVEWNNRNLRGEKTFKSEKKKKLEPDLWPPVVGKLVFTTTHLHAVFWSSTSAAHVFLQHAAQWLELLSGFMLIVVGSSENIIGHFLHVHNYDRNQMKPTELYNDLAVRLLTAELLLISAPPWTQTEVQSASVECRISVLKNQFTWTLPGFLGIDCKVKR